MPDPLLEAVKRNGRPLAYIAISVVFYTVGRIMDGAPKDPTASVMMIMALIALVASFTIPQHQRIDKLEKEIKVLKLQLRGGNDLFAKVDKLEAKVDELTAAWEEYDLDEDL